MRWSPASFSSIRICASAYLNAAAQTLVGLGSQSGARPAGHRTDARRRNLAALVRAGPSRRRGRGAAGTGLARTRRCRPHPRLRGDPDSIGQTRPQLLLEIEDITQHRRLTRENALLAQLGGSRLMVRQLAHEIKNPLGGLRGAAQLLERELLDPALREYTRVIISEADRLTQSARFDAGPGPPAREAAGERARTAGARLSPAAQRSPRRRDRSIATTIRACPRSRSTRTTSFRPC